MLKLLDRNHRDSNEEANCRDHSASNRFGCSEESLCREFHPKRKETSKERSACAVVKKCQSPVDPIDPEPGANRDNLNGLIRTRPYLEPGSDLVALMLLEYQSQAHNALTRASFETRRALYYDSVMNKALDRPADYRSDVTERRIKSVGDELLRFLFYSGESRLTAPIRGTSGFSDAFQSRGTRDSHGRSLRDFDLQTGMFRYPLSYLIDSESFAELPEPVRVYVDGRMAEILDGRNESSEFGHITDEQRQVICEILRDTMPALWERLESTRSE